MNTLSGIVVACRYFVKNKFSSLINITGLAIGLTGFTCIMLYVEHELSFDRFHTRHADIYRIVKDFVNPDGSAVPDATTLPAWPRPLERNSPMLRPLHESHPTEAVSTCFNMAMRNFMKRK